MELVINNGVKIVYTMFHGNATLTFPISFSTGYAIGGLCGGNRNDYNSNVISILDETLTSIFIRGTYSVNQYGGYQNNGCRLIIIGS